MEKRIDIGDVLMGSRENHVVTRIDMPGFIFTEPVQAYLGRTWLVRIDGEWHPLADAIAWAQDWKSDDGVPKEVWIRRWEALPHLTSLKRMESICEKGFSRCPCCRGTGTVTCCRCRGHGRIGFLKIRRCPQCCGLGSHHCPMCVGKGKLLI